MQSPCPARQAAGTTPNPDKHGYQVVGAITLGILYSTMAHNIKEQVVTHDDTFTGYIYKHLCSVALV